MAPPGAGAGGAGDRRRRLSRQARGRRLPARRVRDLDRQDAGVPRAGVPRRRADARPAGDASPVRVAEPVMRGLTFDIAHLLAGSLVLVSFLQLYQDRLYALLNIFALHAAGAGALGRLAGLHPGRAAPLRHRRDRARVQGDRHSGRAAPDHRAARHPPRDREGGRRRPDHAARHGAGRAVDGGDAAGDRRGRSAGARGPRLRARRSCCSAC